jgi:excinuclease UvrABC ATPase subunit
MPNTFSYRPKAHSVDQLKKITLKSHVNLNRYIEEAVNQKIADENKFSHESQAEQLAHKITQLVVKHLDIQLSKPAKSIHEKINKKFEETTKKEAWIPDEDARPKMEMVEKNFGALKGGKKSMTRALLEERQRDKKFHSNRRPQY